MKNEKGIIVIDTDNKFIPRNFTNQMKWIFLKCKFLN